MTVRTAIGVDFGTTNTVIALAEEGEGVRAVPFAQPDGLSDIFRSVLAFENVTAGERRGTVVSHAASAAIQAFLTTAFELRLIQSFKSHAASRIFHDTRIFTRRWRFEDLLGEFLRLALESAGEALPAPPDRVVAGRPVAFVGAQPDERLAIRRYDAGYRQAGLAAPSYVYEPVGAAFWYAQRLERDATVLVGDFGGGTSDFSLIRFERNAGTVRATPIGYAGLGLAGDAFDYRIIDAVIAPALGKGSSYRSMDKILPMPVHFYGNFAKWHQLALLKSRETIAELEELERAALEPEKIATFLDIVRNDRGFALYQAISDAKVALSREEATEFRLRLGRLSLDRTLTRGEFEGWIAADLARIHATVTGLLAERRLDAAEIDTVFLTGGTAQIPAVRRLFEERFGAERIGEGDHFQSVAYGLALVGLEEDVSPWVAVVAG
ncbi:Hsp70 family protein [Salinarimonas ramus]|uniref:Molecular chaperone DnaK n=1 Tax=Salinarimonas ramus TaxID=690164 RepID=A0A917QK49_9HYPH|nr:Hsp70 family protein [Salinarimonas ramus]GGK53068.1 molecular chaperone DnaK [Salinarimonas ramus]